MPYAKEAEYLNLALSYSLNYDNNIEEKQHPGANCILCTGMECRIKASYKNREASLNGLHRQYPSRPLAVSSLAPGSFINTHSAFCISTPIIIAPGPILCFLCPGSGKVRRLLPRTLVMKFFLPQGTLRNIVPCNIIRIG